VKFFHNLSAYRKALGIGLVTVVPLGYGVRFAPIEALAGFSDLFGTIAYQVFFIFLLAFIFPAIPAFRVAVAIALFGWGMEFLQLMQTPFWRSVRATLPGRLLFGTTFNPPDLLFYLLGSIVGGVILHWLQKRYRGSPAKKIP
jgi:Protein of unknown function (DUF2809)